MSYIDDGEIAAGVIIAILAGSVIFVVILIVLCCYCCACCCFVGRRGNNHTHVYTNPTVPSGQMPYQQQPNVIVNANYQPGYNSTPYPTQPIYQGQGQGYYQPHQQPPPSYPYQKQSDLAQFQSQRY